MRPTGSEYNKTISRNKRDLEIALELRLPPLNPEEAKKVWSELIQREIMLEQVAEWINAGWLKPERTQRLVNEAQAQITEHQERLEDQHRPDYPTTNADRLDINKLLRQTLDYLQQNQAFFFR